MSDIVEIDVDEVVYREDLYPRIKPNPQKIQEYSENIEVLPAIEVNQHYELIDGYHRWTAHRKAGATTIKAFVTETTSDAEFEKLAYRRNATHGLQLSSEEKKNYATKHFSFGDTKEDIAEVLSVTVKQVSRYVTDIEKSMREERNRRIREMWLACYTQEEIAEAVGVDQDTVSEKAKEIRNLDSWEKSVINSANYTDSDFKPPLFNIWSFAAKTNKVSHFGNTEQQIVDNLLYLFTQPFDIVVDPFAGGGSTIDVCQERLRRYWVSDRKPVVERSDVRKYDVLNGPPALHKRWQDVSLLYLDPPYWKQAQGEYSDDPEDLANMPLEQFYSELSGFVEACASKMRSGSVVALIIQPTQWRAVDRHFPSDHVVDLINYCTSEILHYKNRIICPYSTEQYNAQMVNWAKDNKEVLTLNRELILWQVVKND